MADTVANLAATMALGAEESITILVCGQWVITPLVNEGVKVTKTVSVYEIKKKIGTNRSSITWNMESC